MDTLTPDQRKRCMRNIRGKNTKPEIIVRSISHALGFRFRLNQKNLPGTPDLVFRKYNLCLFIHGCFWHRHHGCKFSYTPKSRQDFWLNKFSRNIVRDQKKEEELRRLGWRVEIIWECETKNIATLRERLQKLIPNTQDN